MTNLPFPFYDVSHRYGIRAFGCFIYLQVNCFTGMSCKELILSYQLNLNFASPCLKQAILALVQGLSMLLAPPLRLKVQHNDVEFPSKLTPDEIKSLVGLMLREEEKNILFFSFIRSV